MTRLNLNMKLKEKKFVSFRLLKPSIEDLEVAFVEKNELFEKNNRKQFMEGYSEKKEKHINDKIANLNKLTGHGVNFGFVPNASIDKPGINVF